MKILILGGTGAMGKHLVQKMKGTNNQVTVTSRRFFADKENISFIQGNAHDLDFVDNLLSRDFDVIVDFMAYGTEEFKLRYKKILENCGQYIFMSSSRVYADSEQALTEKSLRLLDVCTDKEYLATDEYALAKARQENLLRNSGRKNYTIIRPYITYSENRLQLGVLEKESWLYRALKGRTIVFSNDIAYKYTTLTYGMDVASAIVQLIGNEKAYGETFHITSNQSYPWEKVLSWYLDAIEQYSGVRPRVKMEEKSSNLKSDRTKYQVKYDRYYNRRFDNGKISKFVDTSSFVAANTGLPQCMDSFIKNQSFLYIDWKREAYYDRLTGECASIKEMPTLKQKIKYLIFRYIIFPYKLRIDNGTILYQ